MEEILGAREVYLHGVDHTVVGIGAEVRADKMEQGLQV